MIGRVMRSSKRKFRRVDMWPPKKSKEPALRKGLWANPCGIHGTGPALREAPFVSLGSATAGAACCAPTEYCDCKARLDIDTAQMSRWTHEKVKRAGGDALPPSW